MTPPPTATQKLAVWLAFIAAALSLGAVVLAYSRTGDVRMTPLFGGLFMLVLGVKGYQSLKQRG